jgi:tetratricopeptide (TPR) repeat protein
VVFSFIPVFSLAVKLSAYLHIDRIDLAEKTLATMKLVEEDSCLIILA